MRTGLWEQYCLIHNQLGSKQANLFIETLDAGKWTAGKFAYNYARLATKTHTIIQQIEAQSCKENGDSTTVLREAVYAGRKVFKSEGLSPPTGKTLASTLARMIDPDIWKRKLKQRHKQTTEKIIRDKGRIFRDGEVYCSDHNVHQFIEMQQDNQAFLKRQQVISSAGDELNLAEIAASTVANPAHRRAEMMTRMRGTEEIAKAMGFTCLFVTFTAASLFHPKRFMKHNPLSPPNQSNASHSSHPDVAKQTTGQQGYFIDNPHYQPQLTLKNKQGKSEIIPNTPKVAHAFIKRIMNRSIAKFKRAAIDYMGYKVVEPHHDGTPHWHLAFFIHPDHKAHVTEILTHYALVEYGDEKGAQQRRIVIKDYDPKKGSVTGYMAKYISKGISGLDVGEDYESGLDAEDASIRLLAWKSLWGIRQFSFFGSPSVTVWRELRRLREPLASVSMEQIRLAADQGHWDVFIQLMQATPITIEMVDVAEREGQLKKNQYGEVIERIFGLKIDGLSGLEVIRTRFKEWFLIDLDKLEQRLIKGLPFQQREKTAYLQQIKAVIQQALAQQKIHALYQGTGGVLPFSMRATGSISATPPLGLVRNNVTGDG